MTRHGLARLFKLKTKNQNYKSFSFGFLVFEKQSCLVTNSILFKINILTDFLTHYHPMRN